jgi:2-acylglycerol O-acyltransferase 2
MVEEVLVYKSMKEGELLSTWQHVGACLSQLVVTYPLTWVPLTTGVLVYTTFVWRSIVAATLLALWFGHVFFPRKLDRQQWFVNLPIWELWAKYYQFELISTSRLNPLKHYLFAEAPHGVFPMGPYISALVPNTEAFFGGRPFCGVGADVINRLPVWRYFYGFLGFITARRECIIEALKTKNVRMIPGGVAEMAISSTEQERVFLRARRGFIKLCIQTGADIVPVYHFGNTQIMSQLQFPILVWLSRKLRTSVNIFWGRWGLLIGRRCKIVTVVGPAIPVTQSDNPSEQQVSELQEIYIKAVLELFDKHKHRVGWQNRSLVVL